MLTSLKEDQEHLLKLHKLAQKLATQQDIALTLESPGEKYLKQDEMELIKDLDDAMWDPKLKIPEEFRNLEPIWRKLNKGSLDHTAMKRENKQLMMENAGLQEAMKQYLEVISKHGGEELVLRRPREREWSDAETPEPGWILEVSLDMIC